MAKVEQAFVKSGRRWLPDETLIWRDIPLRALFFYLSGLVFLSSVERLRKGDPE
jgi:hypothetical protein